MPWPSCLGWYPTAPGAECGHGQPHRSPAPSGPQPSHFCREAVATTGWESREQRQVGCLGVLLVLNPRGCLTVLTHLSGPGQLASLCTSTQGPRLWVFSVGSGACVGVCENPCALFPPPARVCSVAIALERTSRYPGPRNWGGIRQRRALSS